MCNHQFALAKIDLRLFLGCDYEPYLRQDQWKYLRCTHHIGTYFVFAWSIPKSTVCTWVWLLLLPGSQNLRNILVTFSISYTVYGFLVFAAFFINLSKLLRKYEGYKTDNPILADQNQLIYLFWWATKWRRKFKCQLSSWWSSSQVQNCWLW